MQTIQNEMITSSKNQHVQFVRELLAKRSAREKSGLFVVEGVRLAEEALQNGSIPRLLFYADNLSTRGMELVQKAGQTCDQIFCIKSEILTALSDTETSQGLLLVLPQAVKPFPDAFDFLIIVDQLRDPGNLGTILRSSLASGVQAVCCTPGSVDAWSPKVVRSAMGAHFRLPIIEKSWDEIIRLCKQAVPPLTLFLAESGGGKPLWQADLQKPLALVIGGEAEGASQLVKKEVDENLLIPMPGDSESLNAAVAASILMFEVVRQRAG